MRWRQTSILIGAGVAALGTMGRADVMTLNPVADAFVVGAHPDSNYGGAGSLSVAAPGLAAGEFQSFLRFDASAAKSTFDAAFGAGHWTIQSVSLQLTATAPNNGIFNASAAGQFGAGWMPNDAWVEGTGTPASPGATGITFATATAFVGGSDEGLGVFTFAGGTSGTAAYPLALPSGFRADVEAGGMVSMRLFPLSPGVSYLFYSRSNGTTATRPGLVVTAVAGCAADFNESGGLTVDDVFDFLNAWFASDPRADFDHIGGIAVQDIFEFLNAWFGGC